MRSREEQKVTDQINILWLATQAAQSMGFQSKAFSITAPAVWNSLSPFTISSATIKFNTFKAHLKTETELFAAANNTVLFLLPPAPPIRTL